MHFSDNWMMDGLATFYFETKAEAVKYVHGFREGSSAHKNDKCKIVKIEEEYEIEVKDQTLKGKLYGFTKKEN